MSSSWIQIDAHGRMSVDDRAATSVLAPLGDVDPLNLISIFGAARQGKSFLMNCLAGREGTFKISNDRDPCTQGIDISRTTVPLREFASMDGGAAVAPVAGASALRVGFVDAEGQGDRDVNYDARLASPVLLMSRCVIFNWKDSLQKDRIIQSLGVMVKAAANVVEGSGGGAAGASSKKFGHLHIVFRDWVFASSDGPAGVYKQLFERERSADHDAMVRNEVRRVLVEEAFESVHVWLFPPPTERVDDLGKQLRPSDLSARFRDGIKGLRAELAAQLRAPMAQFGGRALTGGTLARLAPVLVKTLNSRDVIMPHSAYEALCAQQLETIREAALARARAACEQTLHDLTAQGVRALSAVRAELDQAMASIRSLFEQQATESGASAESVERARTALAKSSAELLEATLARVADAARAELTKQCKAARAEFDQRVSERIEAALPLAREQFEAEGARARDGALRKIEEAYAAFAPAQESSRAESDALREHAELILARLERRNETALAETERAKTESARTELERCEQAAKESLKRQLQTLAEQAVSIHRGSSAAHDKAIGDIVTRAARELSETLGAPAILELTSPEQRAATQGRFEEHASEMTHRFKLQYAEHAQRELEERQQKARDAINRARLKMEQQLPHDNQSSLDLPALRSHTDELFKQFDAECDTAVAQLENAARAAAIEDSLRESRLSATRAHQKDAGDLLRARVQLLLNAANAAAERQALAQNVLAENAALQERLAATQAQKEAAERVAAEERARANATLAQKAAADRRADEQRTRAEENARAASDEHARANRLAHIASQESARADQAEGAIAARAAEATAAVAAEDEEMDDEPPPKASRPKRAAPAKGKAAAKAAPKKSATPKLSKEEVIRQQREEQQKRAEGLIAKNKAANAGKSADVAPSAGRPKRKR